MSNKFDMINRVFVWQILAMQLPHGRLLEQEICEMVSKAIVMSRSLSFNWLHLTDLHLGMKEQDTLLPNIQQQFLTDIGRLQEKCGPWDVVLFTAVGQ